jgi:hypothetical protein
LNKGVPVDDGGEMGVYLTRSNLDSVVSRFALSPARQGHNLQLHVVDDDAWPFDEQQRVVPLWVAWLDLADDDDRAADTVLDRLLGGRLTATT